ncbi:MAG: tetratricopeptide repeat protein [Gemmatimonadaceae bacterium]|nr:tetratricopeptide repeat protein [Gemmatimonadaceae bacterium]
MALPHESWFRELAAMDERSAEWRSTRAGLLALRYVETRLAQPTEEGAPACEEDSELRRAIEAIDSTHLPHRQFRALLLDLLEAGATSPATRLPRLLVAYAEALARAGRWALAADAYETLLAYPPADKGAAGLTIRAQLRLSACLRQLARFDDALRAIAAARESAEVHQLPDLRIRADIAAANVALQRGNLPLAQQYLEAIIETARNSPHTELIAGIMHDLGAVAARRRKWKTAVRYLFRALSLYTEEASCARALTDLGVALQEGFHAYAAARDAHTLVLARAVDRDAQFVAIINLIELDALEGREMDFERRRRSVDERTLPALLLPHYHLCVAEGLHTFGHRTRARAAAERALALAEEHGINEVIIRAEELLAALAEPPREAAAPEPTPEPASLPPSVEQVVLALRTMRVKANL